jgi:hypothetical protein
MVAPIQTLGFSHWQVARLNSPEVQAIARSLEKL